MDSTASNLLMGIVNLTPDSFSDGGSYLTPDSLASRVQQLIDAGAHIIDIGAESTRPGAKDISEADELTRLRPFFALMTRKDWSAHVRFSIDTQKPGVMLAAADAGFSIINNVAGLVDDATLRALAAKGTTYLASHIHGVPRSMQQVPLTAENVGPSLTKFYEESYAALQAAGFTHERIWLDPGIGFGKDLGANLVALRISLKLTQKYHIVVGLSRKSFLGAMLNLPDPLARDPASKMLELGLMLIGVKAIRTHDVALLGSIRQYLVG